MSSPHKPAGLLSLIPSSTADKCTAFINALIRIPLLIYDFMVWAITAEGDVTSTFQTWLGLFKPGDIKATFDTQDQTGWLECNGQVVSRTTYSGLFDAIGEVYGAGDGSTTFQLPDLRGRVIGAAGAGADLTARAVGGTIGAETHTLAESEIPEHTHEQDAATTYSDGNGAGQATAGSSSAIKADTSPRSTGSYGGGEAHNNMQPTIWARYLIKF